MPPPRPSRQSRPRNKPRLRRAPAPASPDSPERVYVATLRRLTRDLFRTLLGPILEAYGANVKPPDERTDAEDRIGIDWGKLRTIIGEITSDRAREIADDQAARMGRFNRDDLNRILGLELSGETKETRAALDAFRRENVALIRSVGADMLPDIRNTVREAARKGTRVEDLRAELIARGEVSESRAELIARDQTLKINSDLTQIRHKEAGIERYVWSTSRDDRVRKMHEPLDGRVFRYDEPPPVTDKKGNRNLPGRDFQCRCVAIPILD